MGSLAFTAITEGISSLNFCERKIQSGSIAIAQAFQEIHDKALWQYRFDDDDNQVYQSFEDYCENKWPQKFETIRKSMIEARYVNELEGTLKALEGTGTGVTPTTNVPMPTKKNQTQAMRRSGASKEDQATAWKGSLDNAGGDPDNVDIQDLKQRLNELMEMSVQDFPIGCPVLIQSDVEGMVFNGYSGHMVKPQANKCVDVRVLFDGSKTQDVTVLTNWLVRLQGPCIRLEPPTPKVNKVTTPKRSPLEQWKSEAIALFEKVLEECESGLSPETVQAIEQLIEKN